MIPHHLLLYCLKFDAPFSDLQIVFLITENWLTEKYIALKVKIYPGESADAAVEKFLGENKLVENELSYLQKDEISSFPKSIWEGPKWDCAISPYIFHFLKIFVSNYFYFLILIQKRKFDLIKIQKQFEYLILDELQDVRKEFLELKFEDEDDEENWRPTEEIKIQLRKEFGKEKFEDEKNKWNEDEFYVEN